MKRPPLSIKGCEIISNPASDNCVNPAVTVVISLYNYSSYIEGCLDSVRISRTEGLPGGFEVIVVDDASTDNSVEKVKKYMATHAIPLCLIKKPVNSGLADTRNLGLQAACAPLVFILDADNEIRPECLLAHYQAITESGCAMAYGIINQFDHDTRENMQLLSDFEWDVAELVLSPRIDAMAMIRKETVLQLGGYSPEYGKILPQGWEDYDLWLKLAQAGHSGKLIPKILSDYRVHSQSMLKASLPYHRDLAIYFTRKFHSLIYLHPDLPTLFGISRLELAMASGHAGWPQSQPRRKPEKFVCRLFGKKCAIASANGCFRFASGFIPEFLCLTKRILITNRSSAYWFRFTMVQNIWRPVWTRFWRRILRTWRF